MAANMTNSAKQKPSKTKDIVLTAKVQKAKKSLAAKRTGMMGRIARWAQGLLCSVPQSPQDHAPRPKRGYESEDGNEERPIKRVRHSSDESNPSNLLSWLQMEIDYVTDTDSDVDSPCSSCEERRFRAPGHSSWSDSDLDDPLANSASTEHLPSLIPDPLTIHSGVKSGLKLPHSHGGISQAPLNGTKSNSPPPLYPPIPDYIAIPPPLLLLRFSTILGTYPDLARVIHSVVLEHGSHLLGRREDGLFLAIRPSSPPIPNQTGPCIGSNDATRIPAAVAAMRFGDVLKSYPVFARVVDHIIQDWPNALGFHPELEIPYVREEYRAMLAKDPETTVLDLVQPIHPSEVITYTGEVDFKEVNWGQPATGEEEKLVSPETVP